MSHEQEYEEELRKANDELAHSAEQLIDYEERWRDRQQFLEQKGYMLRPRFRPKWVPSWQGNNSLAIRAEDALMLPLRPNLTDATRISDGRLVYIKRVLTNDDESRIASLFSQEELKHDSRNHCVPILDSFQDDDEPTISYIVMPFLRLMDDPPFQLVNDIVDFIDQMLEGLVYMHEQGVAHRDGARKNLMMDAMSLYPHGFHPVRSNYLPNLTRRVHPLPRLFANPQVKYYYVDFGISVRFPPHVYPRLALGAHGQDREVPELSWEKPYDPFKVDIFILGNVFKREICTKFTNVSFIHPLMTAMTRKNPEERPEAEEALKQWQKIRGNIFLLQRGWRLRRVGEAPVQSITFDVISFLQLGLRLSSHFAVWVLRLLTLQHRLL